MLNNASGFRKVYIAAGYTDLRRGIDGPASIVKFNFQHLFYCTGPAETAELQPFVKEEKSVPFPDKPFDAVTLPSAEQKEDILFIWNQLEVEFYNGCRSVNPSP